MSMQLIEVKDKIIAKEFLEVPKTLYRKDKNWICPLDAEIDGIFDPAKNLCFQNGEAKRWVLKDNNGVLVGRIAAFIDYTKVNHYDYPTGGAGFFECIHSQEAANILFDVAKDWLSSKEMQAMQAPINFGENYNHWGLLVDGFMPQGYGMPYNFQYYQELFETYGFRDFFGQLSYHKEIAEGFPERMLRFAHYMENKPGFTFEHFSFKNTDKYVNDFVQVYNGVWSAFHDGYTPLKFEEIKKLVIESKMVLEEKFIWFAYNNGIPVGLMAVYPDVNQILAKLKNGKLNLINKIKFLYYRKRAVSRTRVFVTGVLPHYRNSGLVGALFCQLIKVLKSRPQHKQIELSWIGDYNPKVLSMYEKIGVNYAKKHITYMYLFDKDANFRRFTNQFEGKLY